jgi:hypothetical protein
MSNWDEFSHSFYREKFCLYHLVRQIADVLDLSWVHYELAPYYPKIGRPSNRLSLVLSALDRDQDSAFSRARNARFRDSNIFRSVLERVVGACLGAGLVGEEGFAVDANLIVADANKEQSIPGSEWSKERDAQEVGRAAKEYLATLGNAAFGARLAKPLRRRARARWRLNFAAGRRIRLRRGI